MSSEIITGTLQNVSDEMVNATLNSTIKPFEYKPSSSWFLIGRLIYGFKDAIEEQARQIDGSDQRFNLFISYCVSPYAAICMLMAVILNRTVVFASSRNANKLPVLSALLLRSIAILFLMKNLFNVLVALKVQGSGTVFEGLPAMFEYNSTYYKDTYMSARPSSTVACPSPEMFWPLFLSLGLSQFVETFIAVTSGETPYSEGGLTLFEHSLAFQEVSGTMRPTYELLIVSLISVINQIVVHLSGVFTNRYRLIPSSILGISILTFYIKTAVNGRLFNFPVIIIMGYLPQIFVLSIIILCVGIFVLAVLCKGSISDLNFSSFVNIDSESSNVHLHDDFYTALMNLGLLAITSAGKSSYVKELSLLRATENTWLETQFMEESKGGYEKLISAPKEFLGMNYVKAANNIEDKRWVIGKRYAYMKKMTSWMLELFFCILLRRKELPSFLRRNDEIKADETEIIFSPDSGVEISMEDVTEELLSAHYAKFLMSEVIISDYDNSADFELLEDDEESGELEYDSEYESDLEEESSSSGLQIANMSSLAQLRQREQPIKTHDHSSNILNELLDPREFQELINPTNDVETEFARTLKGHLCYKEQGMLTRSKFKHLRLKSDESVQLLELIRSKRDEYEKRHNLEDDDDISSKMLCVVCHTNPREIILWPCRCFAVCESCRVSLVVRGFSGCVCCRRDVEGFSKVFIP